MKNPSIRSTAGNAIFYLVAVLFVVLGVVLFACFGFRTVEGNEVGVRETWSGGVDPTPLPPKTYWINRWTENIFTYPTSGQVFVMNDKSAAHEHVAEGRDADTLEVKSLDNQKVHFNLTVRWRIDPVHVVELHKSYRNQVEERLLRPELVRAMVQRATVQNAIDLYSGEKLNQLREGVENDLKNTAGELRTKGVLVDSFVIDKVEFPNKDYVEAIEKRQLAIIIESQAKEQEKANRALAEAGRAAALKVQYEQVVAAETAAKRTVIEQQASSEKETIRVKAEALNAITQQEAESKKIVLQARADAEKQVALSEAARQSEINRAAGIEAVGRAEAEAQKLRLTAYAVPGADIFARVEVSKNFAAALDKVRFYPANATFNTVAKDFDTGLSLLIGQEAK